MTVLDNGIIRAEIVEKGAEIRRLTVNGEERFYDGNPEFWTGVAPVLFPICGGLKNGIYTHNGNTYEMPKHGFAKKSIFEVEESCGTKATFLLKSNQDTLAVFPWEFEFRIKYSLHGSSLKVGYEVKNLSDNTMYMSLGSHEAYACPEGVEDYDVIFEKKETLKAFKLDGADLTRNYDIVLYESDTLPLYNKYFEIDGLILTDIKSRFVTLRNRKNGKSVSVEFPGCDYLLLWTKPGAPYLCIEPWAGIPSFPDEGSEISEKEGINPVKAKECFNLSHQIYF